MRTANIVRKEIENLTKAKSAYNHFLASYEAKIYPDNAMQVSINKEVVSHNLRELYNELYSLPSETASLSSPAVVAPSALETHAIEMFYSDNRFTIKD